MNQPLPLRDIHLPETISGWPPAPGWWLLAIAVPLVIYTTYRLYRKLTRQTAVKIARKILTTIKSDPHSDTLQKIQQLSKLLRRVTISLYPLQQSAGLTGQAWLHYLDQSVPGSPFSTGEGQCLAEVQFRPSAPDDVDIDALIKLCETWLKAQR